MLSEFCNLKQTESRCNKFEKSRNFKVVCPNVNFVMFEGIKKYNVRVFRKLESRFCTDPMRLKSIVHTTSDVRFLLPLVAQTSLLESLACSFVSQCSNTFQRIATGNFIARRSLVSNVGATRLLRSARQDFVSLIYKVTAGYN